MGKTKKSLFVVIILIISLVPFIIYLLGKDRYKYTLVEMNTPKVIKPKFYLQNTDYCHKLQQITTDYTIYCNDNKKTLQPGEYKIEIDTTKTEPNYM